MVAAFQKDFTEYLKTAGIGFVVGVIPAIILSAVVNALTSAAWLVYLIYAVILMYSIPKLPKEVDTLFEFLIITFIMLAFSGLVVTIVPSLGMYIGWVSLASLETFLTMLVVGALSLGIANKQGWV